jgi:hypothetical protein
VHLPLRSISDLDILTVLQHPVAHLLPILVFARLQTAWHVRGNWGSYLPTYQPTSQPFMANPGFTDQDDAAKRKYIHLFRAATALLCETARPTSLADQASEEADDDDGRGGKTRRLLDAVADLCRRDMEVVAVAPFGKRNVLVTEGQTEARPDTEFKHRLAQSTPASSGSLSMQPIYIDEVAPSGILPNAAPSALWCAPLEIHRSAGAPLITVAGSIYLSSRNIPRRSKLPRQTQLPRSMPSRSGPSMLQPKRSALTSPEAHCILWPLEGCPTGSKRTTGSQ